LPPTLPVDLAAIPGAAVDSIAAYDEAQANQPGARLRPAPPSNLGILSRLSLVETALGPAPLRSPLLRPHAAHRPAPAPQATTGFGSDVTDVFHRSSVGTARKPTGPPS
jgi:hypothetical protein